MYVAKVTNDYDNFADYDNITFTNCTNTENEEFIIFEYLLLSITSSILIFSLIRFMVYTLIKPLFNIKKMEKFLNQPHQVGCIITGTSECGKSVFLTNLILNIINEYNKKYIYSPSLHQDLFQK